jgi:P-type conjugative transfer protein TrbJ
MLANQARNLASLDYSSLAQINGAIARVGGLLVRVEDIAYDVSAIEDAFVRYYPESYAAGSDPAQLFADAKARFEQVMGAARHAMAVQASVVGGIDADRNELATLVGRSQSAVGALQAAQAGNQLLALQVKQLTDLQAMLAADGRARALEAARAAAAQEQAREQRRRFIETPTPYTPVPVRMFHP